MRKTVSGFFALTLAASALTACSTQKETTAQAKNIPFEADFVSVTAWSYEVTGNMLTVTFEGDVKEREGFNTVSMPVHNSEGKTVQFYYALVNDSTIAVPVLLFEGEDGKVVDSENLEVSGTGAFHFEESVTFSEIPEGAELWVGFPE